MTNDLTAQGGVAWQWNADAPGGRGAGAMLQAEDGDRFVFARVAEGDTVELQRLRSTGDPVWTRRLPALRANSVMFLHRAGKLYTALYSDTSTGCRIFAQDAASGDVLWETQLKGLGPLHHSKYSNLVQMRFVDGRLAVFGNESGGKYVEVLDLDTGQSLPQRTR